MIDANDPRVAQIGHPAPPWMVNYADLMTEIVVLYLIMYSVAASMSKPIQEARQAVEEQIKKDELPAEVKVTRDGLIISLLEQGQYVFFETGSADLTDDMRGMLDKLAPTFAKLGAKNHDLLVEGHTDDVPIRSSRYASNWELSSARALSVVQYLVNQHGYPAKHIAPIGYGDNRNLPRAPEEDLVAWRSKNRRVVFVVKNNDVTMSSTDPPDKDAPKTN
jgi:chemotaxis protein MotB